MQTNILFLKLSSLCLEGSTKAINSVPPLLLQCISRIWASLTWLKFIIHRLELISTTAPAVSKNDACFKSGQNELKKNHLALLIYICDTLCIIHAWSNQAAEKSLYTFCSGTVFKPSEPGRDVILARAEGISELWFSVREIRFFSKKTKQNNAKELIQ